MSRKSVLMLGGAGFLGRSIMEVCSPDDMGFDITYADLNTDPNARFNFLPVDVLSAESMNKLPVHYDVILNLIGQATSPSNLSLRLNTAGISNILDFTEKCSARLIHISTINVYGSTDREIDEDSQLNPETPYASFKAFSEFQIRQRLDESQYSILRLSNLYGENQPKGIMAYLLRSLRSDRILDFNNNGDLYRYYLHVKDASRIILEQMRNFNSGIYNISGPDFFSVKELIHLVEQISGKEYAVRYTPVDPWENIRSIDDTRAIDTLNIQYKYNLRRFLEQQITN